jgi:hypothetical protein
MHGKEATAMTTETIPVRGAEVVVLQASAGISFVIEEAVGDRITVRFAASSIPDPAEKAYLLAAGAPQDVVEFAHQLGIANQLAAALRIAQDSFPAAEKWSLCAHRADPVQVEINVTVKGSVDELLQLHTDCTHRWAQNLPLDALGKIALTEDFA